MLHRPVYIVVTPFFPSPTSWRGPFCLDFVKALERTGKYDVKVFVPGVGEDYEIEGIKVYRFPTRQLPSNILPFLFRRKNERSFLNAVQRIGIDIQDVAVCHGHTANFAMYPLAVKRLNPNCQALLHHHDPQSFGLGMGILRHCSLYNAWLFCQFRKLFEQIDCHVFISEMVKRSFLLAPDASWTIYENYRRQMRGPRFFHCRPVRIKRSVILHNGVDTSIFHPVPSTKHQAPSTIFTIGCIANFVDWKDQATLIKAVGLLKEPVKVIFVGSGPTFQHCKELANSIVDLHLQPTPIFEFRTEVPHEQLADFYHSLDLFVLHSYFEGFGCVFTEAWSCGVPFITCEGQGMDDLIPAEARSLWLCKEESPEDLATKIVRYIQEQPQQNLSGPIDIDTLVGAFVKELS